MNKWSYRLFVGLALWLAALTHQKICVDVANTPAGMFLYHGAAALFDFATLVVSAHALEGRLSDDLQALCFASMIVNFLGFLAYMAYAPAIVYNNAIWGLCVVQYGRLLWVDGNGHRLMGFDMVRRRDHGGT